MNLSMNRRASLRLAAGAAAGFYTIHPGSLSFASSTSELDLAVERSRVTIDGETSRAILIGGSLPAPTLRWREGEEVTVRVTNRLDEPTSIHWHGLLLAGVMDGAPGFNGYEAIPAGGTYTYRFQLRQSGTYWYHSHSGAQEQAGMYGAIVIEPQGREPVRADHDHVVLLSDHTRENPNAVFRNLKVDAGYYNRGKRTLVDFFGDAREDGLASATRDALDWADMRMDRTDLADVTGYSFLVNGMGPADNWTALFKPGERIRLRFINGSAMSIFDMHIPDLEMTVVAADGIAVQPVKIDEFRFGVGETYDVIVMPREDRAFTIMAEPIDRSGFARATLAPAAGMEAAIPALRPRTVLTMADMGMAHGGHGGMGMAHGSDGGMDHGAAADPHAGMDHGRAADPHAGMTHGAMPTAEAMGHSAEEHAAMLAADPAGDAKRTLGWADAGTPLGKKALDYGDLKALRPSAEPGPVTAEIMINLGGVMERYIWTINGRRFGEDEPIRVALGDRVRLRFVNETMMAHPVHLHGMFMELENGQDGNLPKKHVILVPPGQEKTALLTADEPGDWPLHCHLLYHMKAGMMARFVVDPGGETLG